MENMHYKYSEKLVRAVVAPGATAGQMVTDEDGQIGVAITAAGGVTETINRGGLTITGPIGGVGNKEDVVQAAFDGSFRFTIDGATDGETVEGAGTAKGTKVYQLDADTVTLSADDGGSPAVEYPFVGKIDAGRIIDGYGPIQIGVPNV